MIILCLGDSLGMPREGCNADETWPSLLKSHYPQHTFIEQFQRARLIDNALSNYKTSYKSYNADITILQLGVVDCAPRYINDRKIIIRFIRKLFNIFGLSNLFWRIVKLRPRNPNCVYTKPKQFKSKYKKLLDSIFINNNNARAIIIKIGHVGESVLKVSPFFNENVDKYNHIIESIASQYDKKVIVINPLGDVDDRFFVDGYHCNGLGMRKVYDSLYDLGILNSLEKK